MRILIITGRFPLLSQSFITNKIIELARRGHTIRVMASRGGDTKLDNISVSKLAPHLRINYLPPEDGIIQRMSRLPWLFAQSFFRDPSFALRLVWLLCKNYGLGRKFFKKLYRMLPFAGERADIMHFEWATKAADYAELIGLFPCLTVMSCRGSDINIVPLMNLEFARDLHSLFARVSRVHCVSQAVLRKAGNYGLDPKKAFINYPSIDTTFFYPFSRKPSMDVSVRIISTGRLHWVKGFDYALKAVRLLVDSGHQVRYTIIGDGDEYGGAQVRFAIQDMELDGVVETVGACTRDDVRKLLAQSDIYLLSSVSEGLSNSVLEAMAMGLPIVTTDVGGMIEAVRDGIDGFIVPSRDPQRMADRLKVLIQDPSLRYQMGQRGREHVLEFFDLKIQTNAFIDFYEKAMEEM